MREVTMFCINCGTEISDKANFCLKCGIPQKPDIEPFEKKYETCQIVWTENKDGGLLGGNPEIYFWAQADGPEGKYNVLEADTITACIPSRPDYPGTNDDNARTAVELLI